MSRSKHIALLAYLAAERPDGSCRRETVMALLWPESDDRHARRSLRQAIYELRRALGTDAIAGHDAEHIGLGDLWCDVREFRQCIDRGESQRAVELFRGDFLPGFHVGEDDEEFESWLADRRTDVRKAAIRAACALTDEAVRAGEAEAATRWSERTHELAPYDEEVLRRLIGLLESVGNRPRAMQLYRQFADRLERDLQMRPGPETVEVVRRLQESAAIRSPGSAGPGQTVPVTGGASTATGSGSNVDGAAAVAAGAVSGKQADVIAGEDASAPNAERRGWASPMRLVTVTVIATVLLVSGLLTLRTGDDSFPPVDPTSVLVTTFVNRTSDPGLDALAMQATDWMFDGVTQMGFGDVFSEPSAIRAGVLRGRENPDTGAALAGAVGAAFVVSGAIYEQADSLSISARVTDAVRGNVIRVSAGTWALDADPGPVLNQIRDDVMLAIAERIDPGLVATGVQNVDRPPLTAAYRAFSEGLRRFGTLNGDAAAAAEFHRAFSLDTTFALPLVWAILAHHSEARASNPAIKLPNQMQRDSLLAMLQARRADLSTLELRLFDYVAATIAGDNAAAYEAATHLARVTSGPDYLKLIATAAHRTGRAADVIGYLQAVDPDFNELPATEQYAGMLVHSLHRLGRYEAEYTVARRAKSMLPFHAITPYQAELRALAALARWEAIDSLLVHIDTTWRVFDRHLWAGMLAETGHELRLHGQPGWRVYLNRALESFPSDSASLARQTTRRLTIRFDALLALGRMEELQMVADSFSALGGEDQVWSWSGQGVVAAAQGDTARALEIDSVLAERWPGGNMARARINALLGNRDIALDHIEQVLRTVNTGGEGIQIHQDPAFLDLHGDPRFRRLMEQGSGDG